MNPSLMSQLDEFARGLVPLGITFTLVLFETMPLPFPGSATVAPALSLIALYYWAVYRPDLMPLRSGKGQGKGPPPVGRPGPLRAETGSGRCKMSPVPC